MRSGLIVYFVRLSVSLCLETELKEGAVVAICITDTAIAAKRPPGQALYDALALLGVRDRVNWLTDSPCSSCSPYTPYYDTHTHHITTRMHT